MYFLCNINVFNMVVCIQPFLRFSLLFATYFMHYTAVNTIAIFTLSLSFHLYFSHNPYRKRVIISHFPDSFTHSLLVLTIPNPPSTPINQFSKKVAGCGLRFSEKKKNLLIYNIM